MPLRAEKSQSARGPSEGPGSSVSEAEHYLGGEQARLLKVPSSTQVPEIHVYWVSSKPCLPDTEGRKTEQSSNCHHTQDSRDKVHKGCSLPSGLGDRGQNSGGAWDSRKDTRFGAGQNWAEIKLSHRRYPSKTTSPRFSFLTCEMGRVQTPPDPAERREMIQVHRKPWAGGLGGRQGAERRAGHKEKGSSFQVPTIQRFLAEMWLCSFSSQ